MKKYLNLILTGLFVIVPIQNIGINHNVIDLATPAATPSINLLHPNLGKLKQVILQYTNKRGELDNVQVTAKDATSITVNNGGTSVKVDITANTHFRRKFWGKSSLAEISVGDSVDVVGRWVNEGKTEINAVVIRDLSIQKRQGVFFGTVKTITDTGFVMTTIQRGEETVTLDSTTKLLNRTGRTIISSDVQVGHTIRVRGLWDSTNFMITEVTEVKDFNLPPVATITP